MEGVPHWLDDAAAAWWVYALTVSAFLLSIVLLWAGTLVLRMWRQRVRTIRTTRQCDAVRKHSKIRTAIVYFWAPWWKPCYHMREHIRDLAARYEGVRFFEAEMDPEENPEILKEFKQMGGQQRPHFVIVRDGTVQDIGIDLDDAAETDEFLAAYLRG